MKPSSTAFDHRKYRPFPPLKKINRRWPDNTIEQAPLWCSVDLRDGNQALIEPMSVAQKKRLFQLLVNMGFKEIEIGFPAASGPDYDFVRMLIDENMIPDDVTIQVLTQARQHLITKTFEALIGCRRAVVHVYNSTSKVQREQVFQRDRSGIIQIAVDGARMVAEEAKKHPDTEWVFQYSPESFTGTEMDFAVDVCNAVMKIWQPTPEKPVILNLPATVEMSTPNIFADQIEWFLDHLENRESAICSVHTHNDRGCAVAAAELAVMAGADRVEGTLFGNGERTGNMDIVTMAMNLYSQGVDPRLDLSQANKIIKIATECTDLPIHPRHPWFGELVYTAFSGSHQDAIRKCLSKRKTEEVWDVAYLPIDPADIGRDYQEVIRINSQSGKGGVAFVLEHDHGLQTPRWLQIALSVAVQAAAETSAKEVSSGDIWNLFQQQFMCIDGQYSIGGYRLEHSAEGDSVEVDVRGSQGVISLASQGKGPLEAFSKGLEKLGVRLDILDYSEHALDNGSDARAVSYVHASVNGQRYCGVGIDQDIVLASLKAMMAAANQALQNEQKVA
ncbi:2-isopropylmalate synthase [Sansalvadorimonas sp. 2012CJ34-2]|uniref:2-isopropylmalate synthase n=1 Tax=Parendozoicomonas callyspongiae TaxID=2942213 RepID=A0ABT0PEF7_9GAMM|nr:2-isopropylmalate synthase [Sansalvadorimonas sp. 2012CJ34-2]MCL6269695.1 2-isopropylmalate synthase [Sansalvadorimonas sp. 2012CJ34-2]